MPYFEIINPDAREIFINRTHGKKSKEINNMLNETVKQIDTIEAINKAKEALKLHDTKWNKDNQNLSKVFDLSKKPN